jgi:hypothetical protein
MPESELREYDSPKNTPLYDRSLCGLVALNITRAMYIISVIVAMPSAVRTTTRKTGIVVNNNWAEIAMIYITSGKINQIISQQLDDYESPRKYR